MELQNEVQFKFISRMTDNRTQERYEDVETWAERLNKWAGCVSIKVVFDYCPYQSHPE